MHLSPEHGLASLGPWTGLLSLPANAQAPLGAAGWLRTGQFELAPHTPLPASSRSCFPVEPGLQLSSLVPYGTLQGQGLGASPCPSSTGSFPEAFSAQLLLVG